MLEGVRVAALRTDGSIELGAERVAAGDELGLSPLLGRVVGLVNVDNFLGRALHGIESCRFIISSTASSAQF